MTIRSALALTLISAVLGGCAIAGERAPEPEESAAAETPGVRCPGPKKRVAILRFGGTGQYGAFEGWDVGEAMGAQLASLLQETDCFVVVDRSVLSEVLREQELGLAGVTTRESAADAGQLLGAQILIKGDITEFEPGRRGNGLTLGLGFADVPLGLRVGGNRQVAHLAVDVRLLDAASGQIIDTQRVESDARTYGMVLGLDYQNASASTDFFDKTPFGQAARRALGEAAGYIVERMQEHDWTGQVVDSSGGQVFVNAGREGGVVVGDVFTVSSVARELVDPGTGVVLGMIERPIGRIRIRAVDQNFAVAEKLGRFEASRGDLLRPAREPRVHGADASLPAVSAGSGGDSMAGDPSPKRIVSGDFTPLRAGPLLEPHRGGSGVPAGVAATPDHAAHPGE